MMLHVSVDAPHRFCRFGSKVRSLAQAVNVCFPWTIMMCLCQAVLCSWHTVLIPFCHAGPFIKAMATHRLFLHTKTTWRLVVFCFQVLSRWYEVGEPKLRVNRSFVPSFDHLLQSPIKVFGAVHYQVALEALLGGPEKKLILENLEWYETETHTVKDQQSRN